MLNRTTLQGRLTADPEIRYTASNVAYLEFTLAWSEKYKDIETKCFLRCKAWRSNAEFLEKYFSKGQEAIMEGHLVTEEWEKDGEKKSRTICIVDKMNFCGPKKDKKDSQGKEEKPTKDDDGFMSVLEGIDEELPFA